MTKSILIFSLVLFSGIFKLAVAQTDSSGDVDFFNEIKSYDLSVVFNADSMEDDSREMHKRAEIIGFIDTGYQRFYIHFNSVIKDKTIPYQYIVKGKTRVRNTIHEFTGTIKISKAVIPKDVTGVYEDMGKWRGGIVVCEVVLYEDRKQDFSGLIKGKLTSNFVIDNNGKLKYDALFLVADSYSNNLFEGTWTDYKTGEIKKCNWGDYRIPDSRDLDFGDGEFIVNPRYIKNGWENFGYDKIEVEWWK